ncbi:MAG: RlmE family RNA methyltransferase [Proteobacteria bacterium]|nr:RlmE family RNA methyltransferase [Pseudomonadota bacterium]
MTTGNSGGRREEHVRPHAKKRRKASSRRWLERQLNDPYVAAAKTAGYRSRAAYKLLEIDDRMRVLSPGLRVIDLGASPGGWTQVAVARVAAGKPGGGRVVAVDISAMEDMPGAETIQADIRDEATPALIRAALDGPADVVLSDMAAPATGHASTDRLRVIGLCEIALDFAEGVLAPGGAFICKALGSGADAGLLAAVKRVFSQVKHVKPPASRSDSSEIYLVATGFRGSFAQADGNPGPGA